MDKEFIDNLVIAYKKLKQENEQLKEATKFLREEADILLQNLKERKADKYRQALEEIREILNKECGIISNAKVVGLINEVLG